MLGSHVAEISCPSPALRLALVAAPPPLGQVGQSGPCLLPGAPRRPLPPGDTGPPGPFVLTLGIGVTEAFPIGYGHGLSGCLNLSMPGCGWARF